MRGVLVAALVFAAGATVSRAIDVREQAPGIIVSTGQGDYRFTQAHGATRVFGSDGTDSLISGVDVRQMTIKGVTYSFGRSLSVAHVRGSDGTAGIIAPRSGGYYLDFGPFKGNVTTEQARKMGLFVTDRIARPLPLRAPARAIP